MTETEWGRCLELRPMLQFLADKMSARKFQLFAVACCRQHWELFCKKPCQQAVNSAERFADGIGTEEELKALTRTPLSIGRIPLEVAVRAAAAAQSAAWSQFGTGYSWAGAAGAADAVLAAVLAQRDTIHYEVPDSTPERARQIALLHEIMGNPFRVVDIDSSWRTTTVMALARRIYQVKDFGALPILADALQDAGCDNDDNLLPPRGGNLLDHCRGPGPHVRGCWVVDLLLGKQ